MACAEVGLCTYIRITDWPRGSTTLADGWMVGGVCGERPLIVHWPRVVETHAFYRPPLPPYNNYYCYNRAYCRYYALLYYRFFFDRGFRARTSSPTCLPVTTWPSAVHTHGLCRRITTTRGITKRSTRTTGENPWKTHRITARGIRALVWGAKLFSLIAPSTKLKQKKIILSRKLLLVHYVKLTGSWHFFRFIIILFPIPMGRFERQQRENTISYGFTHYQY